METTPQICSRRLRGTFKPVGVREEEHYFRSLCEIPITRYENGILL